MVFIIRDRAEQDRSGAPAPARTTDEPLSYTVSGNDKARPAPPSFVDHSAGSCEISSPIHFSTDLAGGRLT